jgi:hypothetical protein
MRFVSPSLGGAGRRFKLAKRHVPSFLGENCSFCKDTGQ